MLDEQAAKSDASMMQQARHRMRRRGNILDKHTRGILKSDPHQNFGYSLMRSNFNLPIWSERYLRLWLMSGRSLHDIGGILLAYIPFLLVMHYQLGFPLLVISLLQAYPLICIILNNSYNAVMPRCVMVFKDETLPRPDTH